jgi:hypothetical protein
MRSLALNVSGRKRLSGARVLEPQGDYRISIGGLKWQQNLL